MPRLSIVPIIIVSLAVCYGASLLLLDAVSFSLAVGDPELGIAKGCYTLFDHWFHQHQPSDAVRIAHFVGSLAVLAGAIYILVAAVVKYGRRQ